MWEVEGGRCVWCGSVVGGGIEVVEVMVKVIRVVVVTVVMQR